MTSAIAECLLIFAFCLNGILAIVNGHVVQLSRLTVVFAEVGIYATAVIVIVMNADRKMLPWLLLVIFIITNGLVFSIGNGFFDPKFIRDVLVIPVFIMLGMTYDRENLIRPLLILQSLVFVIAVLEAVQPSAYAQLFRVLDYYVNTRDFATTSFWNSDTGLFLSATRPGDRFFGFIDLHRLSSIFLEPVSLGNYCVVAAIMIVTYWSEFSKFQRWYMIVSTAFLLIGCDGRFAAASMMIILPAVAILRGSSGRWSVLHLPIIVGLCAVFVWLFSPDARQDNFSGRLAGSMETLSRIGVWGFLGLDASSSGGAADSGIAYFILTQSLFGVAVIWLSVFLLSPDRLDRSRIYVHALALFVSLNLLVSFSFFSLKISSVIWFFYGFLFVKDRSAELAGSSDGENYGSMSQLAAE